MIQSNNIVLPNSNNARIRYFPDERHEQMSTVVHI